MGETIAQNRRARHEYSIDDTFEAGIVLRGTEIKSVRAHRVSLADAYARIDRDEAWVVGLHIAPWESTDIRFNHEPKRARKLLLHRHEIQKLMGRVVERGLTLVPLRMYLNKGRVKVALALVKGKQAHDKRETIRRREVDRETRAAVKARSR